MENESKWPRSYLIAIIATIAALLYYVLVLPMIRTHLWCRDGIENICATATGLLLLMLAFVFTVIAHKELGESWKRTWWLFAAILVALTMMFLLGSYPGCW